MNGLQPRFLTCKYRLTGLIHVYDYQLRYHFLNLNNIYTTVCSCITHRHNKLPCKIVDSRVCPKCQTPTKLLITFEILLAHGPDFINKEIYTCCQHVHTPPCRRCLQCNTIPVDPTPINQYPCAIKSPFTCSFTSAVVCPKHEGSFTKSLDLRDVVVQKHVYNTNHLIFYFCSTHVHRHTPQTNDLCYISTFKCCDDAINIRDYDSSFVVVVSEPRAGDTADGIENAAAVETNRQHAGKNVKQTKYILYDPRIWLDASFNHFISFIRAVIAMPSMAKSRYERFEASNFSVSNIKKYKSGKASMVRLAVTGFETKGTYQTATISCLLPYYIVKIPQNLYDLLEKKGYDMRLGCIKRDPSIKSTCMYVCKMLRNDDPDCETIVIPDAISKPMNQDQVRHELSVA